MRELDFLPDWYPRVRRKKQVVLVQSWVSVAVVVIVGFVVLVKHRAVQSAQGGLAEIVVAMDHTRADLRRLDDLLKLEAEWRQRDEVLVKLGMHVESTRLLDMIEEIMPHEMAIIDMELSVEEAKVVSSSALSRAAEASAKDVPPDRRLKVRLKGVAPTDIDLYNFLNRLNEVKYFENIAMPYAKDRSDSGHVMREYEVTFAINLNAPAVN
jgi:hypothetical protein